MQKGFYPWLRCNSCCVDKSKTCEYNGNRLGAFSFANFLVSLVRICGWKPFFSWLFCSAGVFICDLCLLCCSVWIHRHCTDDKSPDYPPLAISIYWKIKMVEEKQEGRKPAPRYHLLFYPHWLKNSSVLEWRDSKSKTHFIPQCLWGLSVYELDYTTGDPSLKRC